MEIKSDFRHFKPSVKLIKLVREYMIRPDDEETLELIRELQQAFGEPTEKEKIEKAGDFVRDQVFGIFTAKAKELARGKITEDYVIDRGFSHEMSDDIYDRFGTMEKSGREIILRTLFTELVKFFHKPCKFIWGHIEAEGKTIRMVLSDNAPDIFKMPEIPKRGDKGWRIS